MVQLGRVGSEAGFDVSQAFAKSQLSKSHAQELVEMGERERRVTTGIFRHAPSEGVQRQMIHELREYQFSRIHGYTLGKSRELLADSSR